MVEGTRDPLEGVTVNEFASDTHRRVAAQCTRPRSALEIAYALLTLDPNVKRHPETGEHPHTKQGVQTYLNDLERDGLVKNLGEAEDIEALLYAQDADDQVIDYTGDVDALKARAAHPLRFPFPERYGDNYVMTKECHARLTGWAPETVQAVREGTQQGGPVVPAHMFTGLEDQR